MTTIKISLAGASGYTGMESLRYLVQHPDFQLDTLYGNESAGKPLDELYPSFADVLDAKVQPLDAVRDDQSDAMVLALPHGKSAAVVATLLNAGYKGKIIDIGSDFRLSHPEDYLTWYGEKHPHPELLDRFVYGLPEFNRAEIRGADYVANPGCFATAMQLGIVPLCVNELTSTFHVTGITGSSGSGVKPSPTTHFSSRFGNVKAYKVYKHQHLGEVGQHIQKVSGLSPNVYFTPVSGPFVRGIWMTISGSIDKTFDLSEAFEGSYYNAPLVRLRPSLPELKTVVGAAYTDIGWQQNGDAFSIGVALDNMGKGAAGQMIQNLNLMFDLPEETGLRSPGLVL